MGTTAEVLPAEPPESPIIETGTVEDALAEVLAEVMRAEHVSVESNFFDDLGADSMVMAHFCARVRKRPDLPSLSIKDVYRNPTIRSLATALVADAEPAETQTPAAPPVEVAPPIGKPRFLLCGALQALIFLGYTYLAALIISHGYEWVSAGSGLLDVYLRAVMFGGAAFLGLCLLPIALKWILVGRWKPQRIRVWSLAYVRFWLVKTVVRVNPLMLFVGSPLYAFYLRALGAKVGPGVAIFSRNLPVCTDLLTIGGGSVIRKDSFISGYRARDGVIETGAVTLGRDVFVGEATVIDIETSMGDGAQLGHTSSLHSGQAVPAGQHWHGSPAQRTEVNYRTVEPLRCGTLRRIGYSALQVLSLIALYLPLAIAGVTMLLIEVPQLATLMESGPPAFTSLAFYLDALATSLLLFFSAAVAGLLFICTVPRVLGLALKPDKVYRLYGFRYWAYRVVVRTTNSKFLTFLFGDSSYIVNYLRWIGYDLSQVEQTGSNFGQRVKHESPYLTKVGSGTMVADGLSVINSDLSNSSFRMTRTEVGAHSFLGNNIVYPSGGRTGDNCLLATKVLVPLDGKVRENVGLLGSPSFEIPRTVERDTKLDIQSKEELQRRLSAKNKHNLVTMGLYLLVRWFYFFCVTLLASFAADHYAAWGTWAIALANVFILLFTVVYFVSVERCVSGLQALRPQGCSIYERSFWRHERFWKVPAMTYVMMFNGTPFKSLIWRGLGVRIGRRVFDDGCGLAEKTFVTIGDRCTLNAGTNIQCHSQEDGGFKSDVIVIGSDCTLGVGAFVHYGVTIGDGVELAPDSFLMKGEEVPQQARWGGNPAREMQDNRTVVVGN